MAQPCRAASKLVTKLLNKSHTSLIVRNAQKFVKVTVPIHGAEAKSAGKRKVKKDEKNSKKNKCKQYLQLLMRCQEACLNRMQAHKKILQPPTVKPDTPRAEMVYQTACDAIDNRMKETMKFIDSEVATITVGLEDQLGIGVNRQVVKVEELTRDVMRKMQELMAADAICGSKKRTEMLALNEQARMALNQLDCEVMPSVQCIKSSLAKIRCEVLDCLERSSASIRSCHVILCQEAMIECVEENSKMANKAIDELMVVSKQRFEEIRKFRAAVAKNHEKAWADVTNKYQIKMEEFACYLDRCIYGVKRK